MTGRWVPAPMALLEQGIPLSLLLDLALGPQSEDLLIRERATAGVGTIIVGADVFDASAAVLA